jgi:predicted esterase YcpF (UPF0227 family)
MPTEIPKENSSPPIPPPADNIDRTLALATALETIKTSPAARAEFAKRLVEDPGIKGMIYRCRPKGPYYNKERAMEVKAILDNMMKDGKPKAFYSERFNCKMNTLVNRLTQSINFLTEDPEMIALYGSKYREFWGTIKICQEHDIKAVVIRFEVDPKANPILPLSEMVNDAPDAARDNTWKQELDKWLEDTAALEPFIKKVTLTQEEANELDYDLSQLAGILATVEVDRIKVIKFNAAKDK